jgi:putative ABC transport system permease protein
VNYGSVGQTAIAIAVLAALTLMGMQVSGVRQRADYLGAVARSLVQLVLVAAVIAWIFRNPAGTVLYLAIMLLAATATSVRRIGCGRRSYFRVLVPIAGATGLAVAPVVASGALPLAAQSLLPFAAQVIGGAMTAASLSGTRFRDDVRDQWDVVEGHLALGATSRQAVSWLGRRAVEKSLIPSLDQTRSAGLVVLPGAFVGMLLGGASPAQAAQIQLLVLVALLAAATWSAVGTVWMLAPGLGLVRPAEKAASGSPG